jgi:hypothetical protein
VCAAATAVSRHHSRNAVDQVADTRLVVEIIGGHSAGPLDMFESAAPVIVQIGDSWRWVAKLSCCSWLVPSRASVNVTCVVK